ncbi:hypothetical protein DA100_14900 [Vibrio sp. Hep-1b-8]|nr:hypothetical protein DA100_14900 [Vibrio sp. Hep-1b-8]
MFGDYIRYNIIISLTLSTFNNKNHYSFINKSPNSLGFKGSMRIKKATTGRLWERSFLVDDSTSA